ncbi:hypothetical protein QZH41_018794, partial [Actinostola sp. cb2023]
MTTRSRAGRSFYCREWVYEKIQTCLERRKQHDDIKTKVKGAFIVGGPGSGKTTLLSELVSPSTKDGSLNELSGKVVAYHFCEAHRYSSVSVSEFIRSLAEQLSNAEPLSSYREKFNDPQIQDALRLDYCAKNPDVSFKEGILLPLNSITPPEDVFVVVVDSIDESFLHSFDSGVFAGSRTIAELLAAHHELLPSWLFLVVSARKQSKTVIKMFTGFRKLTLDDLRKAYVVRDIQGYILNRLDDDKELRKYLTRETAEKFNQLHIKSNGCFLYLEKVLEGVEDQIFSIDEVQEIPEGMTQEHFALWLLWSGAPLSEALSASELPRQEALQILLDAGADINAEQSDLALNYGKETEESIKVFLEKGAYVDRVDSAGRTQLCNASFNGNADVVRILLQHGASVNFSDPAGESPLMLSAKQGHADVVYLLVNCGANVNQVSNDGCTALRASASGGHSDVVAVLLKNGAIVDQADDDKRTALRGAAWGGHTDVVQQLIQHGANPNLTDKDGSVVKLLINVNADISHWDRNGRTPLFAAAASGHVGIIKLLLEKNHKEMPVHMPGWRAPKDAMFRPDNSGWTPLMVASFQGHTSVVKALLEAGVQMDDQDKDSKTALIIAAQEGHAKVVSVLLDFGAPVSQATNNGRTALYYAAMEGHFDCVDTLMKFAADLNGVDDVGRTALFSVTIEGNEAMVHHLLKHGATVDSLDDDGRTPLQGAAWQGNYNLVELLLKFKANVNLPDTCGRTALMSAAWQGQNSVIQLLIDEGAEVDKVSFEGATALSIACQEGHDEVAQILLDNGANMNHNDTFGRTPMQVASEA